ncbi:MAG TPA: UDP-glucose 4-epimerase GalE [Candidatus Limnocylindrales bacterium]
MRVLVTGGAGYIGSVSAEVLLREGHDVVVLDDLSTGHRAAVPDGASLEVASYGDTTAVDDLLAHQAFDAILHCAARSLVGESVRDPARYYRDNVAGGIALLEVARGHGVRRFVFSSTAAVYGTPRETPIREDADLRPINPYGETKRTFEGALAWYAEAYGFRSVSLRYFNAAGASEALGEDHRPETHLIPIVLRAAMAGDEVTVFGDDYRTPDGTCIRDYIHVLDLARAHLLALEATAPDDPRTGKRGEPAAALVCNLGSGRGYSVREVLTAAERAIGRPIAQRVGPRRAGDPPVLVASADRAREVLGWTARQDSLEAMIDSAWAWQRRHPEGYAE